MLPVKNTFIHFDTPKEEEKAPAVRPRRMLRATRSDPEAYGLPAVPSASKAEAEQGAKAAVCCMPLDLSALKQRSTSGDDSTDVTSTAVHTPEHTPRHWALSVGSTTSPDGVDLQSVDQMSEVSSSMEASPGIETPTLSAPSEASPGVPQPIVGTCDAASSQSVPSAVPSDPFKAGFIFTFTLRLADNVGLGLDVARSSCDSYLTIQQILQHGAIEAWNRQCFDGGMVCMKVVMPGDLIVGINGASGCTAMLQECKDKYLLKVKVLRPYDESAASYSSMGMGWDYCSWSQSYMGFPSPMAAYCAQGSQLPNYANYTDGDRLHSCKLPVEFY